MIPERFVVENLSAEEFIERVKEMPAGRARFEIARHLMTLTPQN